MSRTHSSPKTSSVLMISIAILSFAGSAWAAGPNEKVLYSFGAGSDGINPSSSLVADQLGNLYGTTTEGGAGPCTGGCGTVFELKPAAGGGWTESVLYNFQGGNDGSGPMAGLILDAAGNLYGTTIVGGPTRDGIVFQLAPSPGGVWTETILHNFADEEGAYPVAPLIFDRAGNLYGTTVFGGKFGNGTVFELTPSQSGVWTQHTLHDFTGRNDGLDPESGLIFDQRGNLYGTTAEGVFKMSPPAVGHSTWTLKVLSVPSGGPLSPGTILAGKNGVLYGTQKFGVGPANAGAVFQLTPPATQGGAWTETTIYTFTTGNDGAYPYAGLIADANGNLYGTTTGNGQSTLGTVFRLTPPAIAGGAWTETTLHAFAGGSDGSGPSASLIPGKAGALYGTTAGGGALGKGTVFKIVP